MKKSLLLLISIFTIMFTACSSDDPDDNGGGTTDTSFIVKNTNDAEYRNVVAGYFAKDGKCKLIATIGDLVYNQTSSEIKVTNSEITEVFLFVTRSDNETYKMDPGHKIEKGKKNAISIAKNFTFVSAPKDNDTKYPH